MRKTDNSSMPSKLALRRHFLAAHPDCRRVLDCCQGGGLLWKELRAEVELEAYLGLDLKAKPGRLRLDSARYLAAGGWDHNLIDVDTYGSPWKHWRALLPNAQPPLVVILTQGALGPSPCPREAYAALGLAALRRHIPKSMGARLVHLAAPYLLAQAQEHGLTIVEALEAPASPHARYFGLYLEKS